MFELLTKPWPWYVGGPLLGLLVPILYLVGNKAFGISSNFRHICAMCFPASITYFKYDWRKTGMWQLLLLVGLLIGSFAASISSSLPYSIDLSVETIIALEKMGIQNHEGLIPLELFNWESLFTIRGFISLVLGGFLVGFGSRYANGCTSGHTISGISNLQASSLVATIGFFLGGLFVVYLIYPILF